MGLCKASNFPIFTFIDCKMMTSNFRTIDRLHWSEICIRQVIFLLNSWAPKRFTKHFLAREHSRLYQSFYWLKYVSSKMGDGLHGHHGNSATNSVEVAFRRERASAKILCRQMAGKRARETRMAHGPVTRTTVQVTRWQLDWRLY